MEPPAKRRRKGQSPIDQPDDDEDDDELFFQPFEVEAKRDPGYKFSMERAYADHRFQVTMAHIFEKYSRNFEGIGDEIDLVTGEIVVNNGHVRNMQNEGDVGDGLVDEEYPELGDGEDDEDDKDEGILLEDLTDGEEDDVLAKREAPQNQSDPGDDTEDAELIVHGNEPLLALTSTGTPSHAIAQRIPDYTSQSSPLPSAPAAIDSSPFPTAPWDIPGLFPEPSWGPPELILGPVKTPRSALAHRYHFKPQAGRSSIWAPRSKYKEDEDEPLRSAFDTALGRHLAQRRLKPRKSLLPPAVQDAAGRNDDDDEDFILTGKNSKELKIPDIKAPVPETDEDAHEELSTTQMIPTKGAESEPEARENDATDDTPAIRPGRKRRRRSTVTARPSGDDEYLPRLAVTARSEQESSASSRTGAHSEVDSYAIDDSYENTPHRRRSGRARKPVEYLNKISWTEALGKNVSRSLTVELPILNASHLQEFVHLEIDATDEGEKSVPAEQVLEASSGDSIPQPTVDEIIIPDSTQESSSSQECRPFPEDAPEAAAIVAEEVIQQEETLNYQLSDDEAPTQLSKPRKVTKPTKEAKLTPPREVALQTTTLATATSAPDSWVEPASDSSANDVAAGVMAPGEQQYIFEPYFIVADSMNEGEESSIEKEPELTEPSDNSNDLEATEELSRAGDDNNNDHAESKGSILDRYRAAIREYIPCSDDSSDEEVMTSSPTRHLTKITAEVCLQDGPRYTSSQFLQLRDAAPMIPSSSPPRFISGEVGTSPTPPTLRKRRGKARNKRTQLKPPSLTDLHVPELPAEASQAAETPPVEESQGVEDPVETTELPMTIEANSNQELQEEPIPQEVALPSPRRTASPAGPIKRTPSTSPSKSRAAASPTRKLKHRSSTTPLSKLPTNPQTPRHRLPSSLRIPSSRRSILSLLSDNEDPGSRARVDDEDEEVDELGRNLASLPASLVLSGHTGGGHSSAVKPSARKLWKSSARTTEVYRTPVKKRSSEPVSPGSLVRTPGGSMRACGVGGFRCGRDFCFTCL